MLPTYAGAGGFYGGPRRRKSKDDTPWGLLLVLLLAGCCLMYTRRRSLAALDQASPERRDLLQRTAHDASIDNEEAPKEASLLSREKRDQRFREAIASAPGFNPQLHATYEALPPLPASSEAELNGGWQFTPSVYDYSATHPGAEVISWEEPRLVMFRSFLNPKEVLHVVGVAKDHLERSSVLSAETDEKEEINDVRTSYGAWPARDSVFAKIYERIHRVLGIPEQFGEDAYILNYKLNQRYDAHNDNCMDDLNRTRIADEACKVFLRRAGGPECGPGKGGPTCGDRVATFILFLKAPRAGGRTVFPNAALTQQRLEAANQEDANDGGDSWYCKTEQVLGVSPSPGDAILFWDYRPGNGAGTGSYENGTAEPSARPVVGSLHSGCPVLEGEKWIATRWIRASRFV